MVTANTVKSVRNHIFGFSAESWAVKKENKNLVSQFNTCNKKREQKQFTITEIGILSIVG
jgi:hypothetical protein